MTILYFDRRTDGVLELLARFEYSDLAELAAKTIVENMHWPVVMKQDGYSNKRFEWRPRTEFGVVEINTQ